MSLDANKQVVRRLYGELVPMADLSQLEALAAELLAPSYRDHNAPESALGPAAYCARLRGLRRTFPDLRIDVRDVVAEGDRVVSRVRGVGTHLGEYHGLPPTGRRVHLRGIFIDRLENGQVAEHWGELDTFGLLVALGLPVPATQHPGARLAGARPIAERPAAGAEVLVTERLLLEPITVPMVEAVVAGDWRRVEELTHAAGPAIQPGPELIHRGFGASLERIRKNPGWRLWGDRFIIDRGGERRILGSVVFHGHPGEDGIADVGYGVEAAARGKGIATEAVRACVEWALAQPGVHTVEATAHELNRPSLRVLEKVGMRVYETRDELFGNLIVYRIERSPV